MSLKTILDMISEDGASWIILLFVLLSIIQIAPIKLDPWSRLFKWIGSEANKDLNSKIENISTKLDKHIQESVDREVTNRRTTILDFANSCMNNRKHTKEEFDFIISECDKYEIYCLDNHIPNGVADASIKEIKRIYDCCIRDNSFLKEQE